MRILFFSTIFPRPWHPTHGIFNLRLCKAWREAGHALRVVAPRSWLEGGGGGAGQMLADMGPLEVEYPRYFYTPGVLRSVYDRFMWASVAGRLRRAIDEFEPDCIISYWVHPDGAVGVRAAREAGLPSAIVVGGSDVLIQPREDPRRGRRIVAALQAASAVITVSRHLAARVVAMGVPAQRVHVVYQGVEAERFCPGDQGAARRRLGLAAGRRILVCVGRLVPVKGMEVLLGACGLLRERGLEFQVHILGDGPSRGALERQVRALHLEGHVFFGGTKGPEQLPDWYRAADLTVLSSHSEGLPNVLRESLACGTPLIATDVGGIGEIAAPGWSVLVPPGRPDALADAIGAWFAGAACARPRLAVETWAHSAGEFLRVMRPLVAAASAARATPSAAPAAADLLA